MIIKGSDGKIETEKVKVSEPGNNKACKSFHWVKKSNFESHDQQIIKEITVKNSTNFLK